MKVIYIAGPFRGSNSWEIEQNIRRAETLNLEVWRAGAVAICPHTNTRFFQGAAPDSVWLEGYLEVVRRCDALIYLFNSEDSSGTQTEIKAAKEYLMPIFEALQGEKLPPEFNRWLIGDFSPREVKPFI